MNKKLFIILESIIYIVFIALDIINVYSSFIKYLGIILCLIYVLSNNKKDYYLSSFFTLIADLFLLMLDSYYYIGILFFIVVQYRYASIINKLNSKYTKSFSIIRLSICIFGIIVLFITNNLSLTNAFVIIYFSNLLLNAFQSISTKNILLILGLFLFLGCDICVGIHNISNGKTIADILMWIFYLPSQVLISLS